MNDPIWDRPLVDFLKNNRPVVPDATVDLESKIMAAIDEEIGRETATSKIQPSPINFNKFWLIPPAIAASFLVAWSGYQRLSPSQAKLEKEEHLEAFLIRNWEGTVGEISSQPASDFEREWEPLAVPTDN